MTTIAYNPHPEGLLPDEDIPVFDYFARRVANTEFEPLELNEVGTTWNGTLTELPDPAPNRRLEIERTAGVEEVRWIDTSSATYRSATGDTAKRIIAEWDAKEAAFFADADPDPEEFRRGKDNVHPSAMQRDCPYYRCFVIYDSEGKRDTPMRKLSGKVTSAKEFWDGHDAEPYARVYVGTELAFWVNGSTGQYYVAEGKDLVDAIKQPTSDVADHKGAEL